MKWNRSPAHYFTSLLVLLLFGLSEPLSAQLKPQSKTQAQPSWSKPRYAPAQWERPLDSNAMLQFQRWQAMERFSPGASEFQESPWDSAQALDQPSNKRFGEDLFSNRKMSFAPRLEIAPPPDYRVGPGDVLSLSVYGVQELDLELKVSPDASINVPYAGMLKLAGQSLTKIEQRLRYALIENGFESLARGESGLSLSVARYRSIPITVVGAKQSGHYLVPAVATVFHALYLAGGPDSLGSFRKIALMRQNQQVQEIDLYDFLLKGHNQSNLLLRENDVVLIPLAGLEVEMRGALKRPARYELKEKEGLKELMDFCGGFKPNAHRNSINVERFVAGGRSTFSLSEADFEQYQPAPGDRIKVAELGNLRRNQVHLAGAVYQAGTYGYLPGLELRQFLQWGGGVKESALKSYAVLYRYQEDHQSAYFHFVPEDILSGRQRFTMKEGDSVVIADKQDLFPRQEVEVRGNVLKPSVLPYAPGLKLSDALLLAGGFSPQAVNDRVELYRRRKDSTGQWQEQVFDLSIDADFSGEDARFPLQAHDVIMVHEDIDKRPAAKVYVEGEFGRPGTYVLPRQGESIGNLLKRAGGLGPKGNPNAVFILRNNFQSYVSSEDFEQLTDVALIKYNQYARRFNARIPSADDEQPWEQARRENQFTASRQNYQERITSIDSFSIISVREVEQLLEGTTKPEYNIKLVAGDRIICQPLNNSVRVMGMVQNEGSLNFSSKKLKSYLDWSGGLRENADASKIFIIEPNGLSRQSHRGLWRTRWPKVLPGSIVVVPPEPEEESSGLDASKLTAAASILTSTAGVLFMVFSIIQQN